MTPVVHDRQHADRSATKFKRGRAKGWRPWSKVTGITLHQTASGNLHADHRLLLAIPAHAIVHCDGSVSLLHAPTSVVYHGHGLNAQTIGIEIDCRAAGTEGDASTFWRSTTDRLLGCSYELLVREATAEQLEAARWLVSKYAGMVEQSGGRIATLWAHRQSHSSRTSDPGSRIWKGVALPMIAALGLVDVSHLTLGTGRAIPKEWQNGT